VFCKRIIAIVLGLVLLAPPAFAVTKTPFGAYQQPAAEDTAQILGIKSQVERYKALSRSPNASPEELLFLKTLILRKILRGVLEVRQACNKLDFERAYTYDILQKEERRQHFIYQLYNTANFAQLSTFYTLEPFMRIHDQFVTSAIFTTTSGSLNTTISTMSRVHSALAKASHVAPPEVLANVVDGGPVDSSGLPPLVTKYLDAKAPNADKTRRELLFANWMKYYKIDASKKSELCAINDKKRVGVKLLRSRVLLLWSLHTFIQDFDRQLLVLLNTVQSANGAGVTGSSGAESVSAGTASVVLNGGAQEMAKSLHLMDSLAQLQQMKQAGVDNQRVQVLELHLLERTLTGALELQVATDKVDEDLYYNYHIALSELLQNRAKWLQYNYNANFLQSGILGIVAGRLYLSRHSYAGDRMFVISGSNGTALTLLAMLQMRGGKRKVDTSPNSLAEVFKLQTDPDDRFSAFVSRLLNAPPPGSTDGKTRAELLNEAWRKAQITTMKLDSSRDLSAISAMPSHKFDTIKIVENRIVLLQSLKKELESFQGDVLAMLRSTE